MIDYGSNLGIEWVILSNSAVWQIYKIHFKQPVEKTLIYEIDLLKASHKNPQLLECMGNLSREGFTKSSMATFCQQQQITSKFSLAAILIGPTMLTALRKEIRRISPAVKIEEELLKTTLQNDVLKREVVESDEAKQASELLKKAIRATEKSKAKPAQESIKVVEKTPATGVSSCVEKPIDAS